MSEYDKPLPVVQSWSQPFWDAARQHGLIIQRCEECGTNIFYPRRNCPECWSPNVGWINASGKGKVYAYSITLAGVEDRFAADLPFVLALVDLREGVRMMTNIIDCRPEDVVIGMNVEVVFKDITTEFSLPMFRPVRPE